MSDRRCEEFRELASAYADEGLEGQDLLRLERHFDACPACREFEAGIRRLRELLRAADSLLPAHRPSPGFAAAVMARAVPSAAAATVQFPPARRPVPAWVGMALAAAAAAVFFVWSWQRLLPVPPSGPQVAVQSPADTEEEGSMESYLLRHAALAREATLLGSAEEIDFAAFHTAGAAGR